jgi:hypothetical protein
MLSFLAVSGESPFSSCIGVRLPWLASLCPVLRGGAGSHSCPARQFPASEDGASALIDYARCRRPRNGEQPHTQRGRGASRRLRPPCPVSAPRARGAELSRRHGREPAPDIPCWDLVVTLAISHAFLSGTPRRQLSISLRGLGLRTACRRTALETEAKVVTASVAITVHRRRFHRPLADTS